MNQKNKIQQQSMMSKGDHLVIYGDEYEVAEVGSTAYLLKGLSEDEPEKPLSFEDFAVLAQDGNLRVITHFARSIPTSASQRAIAGGIFATLDEGQQKRVRAREAIVLGFLELERRGWVNRTDKSIAREMKGIITESKKYLHDDATNSLIQKRMYGGQKTETTIIYSSRSILEYVRRYGRNGIHGLLDNWEKSGNRKGKIATEVDLILRREVRKFLDKTRPTKRIIYQNVCAAIHLANKQRLLCDLPALKAPSEVTVRKRIDELNPFEATAARHGTSKARAKFQGVFEGVQTSRPLERVEIDEYQADLITLASMPGIEQILAPETIAAMGLNNEKDRWWVSVAQCTTTKCIVGLKVTRTPNSATAVQTLSMITEDKTSYARSVGASNSWHQCGIPEQIVTDSGVSYQSGAFRSSCAALGAASDLAPAGLPQVRGSLERFFATIGSNLLTRLPGRTFSNAVELGDYDAVKEAALSTDDFLKILIRWIVDIYHCTPHNGLNLETPQEAWDRLTRKYPPRQLHAHINRIVAFGTELSRTVTREGVQVCGVYYNCAELNRWMARSANRSIKLRWLPSNLGSIAALIDDAFIEVPSTKVSLTGIDYQMWEATKRHLRSNAHAAAAENSERIYAAIDFIRTASNEACQRSSLVTREWGPAELEAAERSVFTDFSAIAPEPFLSADGREILSHSVQPYASGFSNTNQTPHSEVVADGLDTRSKTDLPDLDDGEWGYVLD